MEPNVYAQFQWTIIVFTTKLPFSQYPLVTLTKNYGKIHHFIAG